MLYRSQQHLSFSEISKAIEGLSDAAVYKLKRVADLRSKNCGMSSEDLLQEAFTKSLAGDRLCPRDVDIVRFLSEAMRSIASSNAKSYTRHPEVSLQTPKRETGSDYQADFKDSKQPSAESVAITRIDLAHVQDAIPKLFESDSEAIQLLAMGIVDGMDVRELQEFSGLRGTEYNSARRLFRRRIEKAFPRGE
jgi:RNA polymerase sigma-70 factor (ECF subfamily)